MVNACVGANEPEVVLHYDRSGPGAHYLAAFPEHELHQAGILIHLSGQFPCRLAGRHIGKVHHPALGLAYDLLPKDEDIVVLQGEAGRG